MSANQIIFMLGAIQVAFSIFLAYQSIRHDLSKYLVVGISLATAVISQMYVFSAEPAEFQRIFGQIALIFLSLMVLVFKIIITSRRRSKQQNHADGN